MFIWNGKIVFTQGNDAVTIRQVKKKDIPMLCKLYEETLIDKTNYKVRLSPKSIVSFGKIGGMFSIYGAAELQEIMNATDSMFMLAAFDESENAVGIVWSAKTDAHFDNFEEKYIERPNFPEYTEIYHRLSENNELIYGREIIVTPSVKIKGVAACLMYALLHCDKRFGYRYTTGEVYNVYGYEDKDGFTEAKLFNGRSFHVLTEQTGGDNVCGFKEVKRELDGFNVYYDSEVIIWDYDKINKKFKNYLINRGFTISIIE